MVSAPRIAAKVMVGRAGVTQGIAREAATLAAAARLRDFGLNLTLAGDPNQVVFGFLGSPDRQLLSQQTNAALDSAGAGRAVLAGPVEPNLCREGRSAPPRSTRVPAPEGLTAFAGRQVRLGVRPEAIALVEERTPDAAQAVVLVHKPLGSSVLLTTELGGHILKTQTPARFRAEPGDPVWTPAALDRRRAPRQL